MLYTYRIERVNGVEFVIQEHYRKRIFTQDDSDNFQMFKSYYATLISEDATLISEDDCDDEFDGIPSDLKSYFLQDIHVHGSYDLDEVSGVESLKVLFRDFYQIPVMETFPCCVVRGVVIDNKVVEIQCSYVNSVLPGEVESDIHRFYGLFDSIHWRNTIAYQRDRQYGCLFEPSDFEKAGTE